MFYYKLAGLTVCVEGDWPMLGQGRLREYAIEPPADGFCDVKYVMHQECSEIAMPDLVGAVEVNKRKWMKRPDGGYTMIDWIPEFSEKVLNRIDANADWSHIDVQLCREDFSGLDKDLRAFHAFGEMLPYVLFHHEGIVFHSSCISYQGQAVLFSAPSGTGKSTHTRLWQKYYPETVIINDDMPALRLLENETGARAAFAFGTPWAGKTQLNENTSAPVRAIVFLKRGTVNSIRRVNGAHAAFLLMQAVRKPVLEDLMSAQLDIAAQLMELVPAFELTCDMSQEAVETVRRELF